LDGKLHDDSFCYGTEIYGYKDRNNRNKTSANGFGQTVFRTYYYGFAQAPTLIEWHQYPWKPIGSQEKILGTGGTTFTLKTLGDTRADGWKPYPGFRL